MPETRRALIAAGGTGGHIWPGVAVARVLESRGWQCTFVSGNRPVEQEVYSAAGIEPLVYELPRPNQNRLATFVAMFPMFFKTFSRMEELKPHVVLSMGGYVSAPVVMAGIFRRVPTILVEPNSVPGTVNRRLAPYVSAVAVADPKAGERMKPKRLEVTGNPQMWDNSDLDREAARERFGLREGAWCLLVAGGSQGARRVNALVLEMLQRWADEGLDADIDVLWVAGSSNAREIEAALPQLERVKVQVHGHIVPFQDALAVADLALSRAGAGSVADLALAGLPSILFPLPIAKDDHQRANAARLAEHGAALIFDERSQTAAQLDALVCDLLAHPEQLKVMTQMALTVAQPDAAEAVADLMESFVRSN